MDRLLMDSAQAVEIKEKAPETEGLPDLVARFHEGIRVQKGDAALVGSSEPHALLIKTFI